MAEVYEKYSHDGKLASYVQTATAETFKAVTARYSAPDLISTRASVSNDIASLLREKMRLYVLVAVCDRLMQGARGPRPAARILEASSHSHP